MLWLLRNSKALVSSSKALISSCFFILVCQENLIAALPLLSRNMQCGSDEDLCMTMLLSVYGLPGPKYYLLCFFRHVSKMLQAGNFCWSLRSPNVQEDALTTCWLKLGGQKAWPSSALLVHRCLSRTGILCETRLLCDPRAGSAPARGARPGHFQGCSHREAWGASSGNPLRCWGKSPPYTEGLTHPRGACGSARGQAGPLLQCWKRTVYEVAEELRVLWSLSLYKKMLFWTSFSWAWPLSLEQPVLLLWFLFPWLIFEMVSYGISE